jgi:16S rRNA (adenine1518-N6/adenine1519-N6)-dimethyltransferase
MEVFASDAAPARLVVTVQREVAERLAALPGTKDYGLLTVAAQLRYETAIRKLVSPSCFLPAPEVQSAIVVLTRHPRSPSADLARCRALAKRSFAQRRKKISTSLALDTEASRRLSAAGVSPDARPEDLPIDSWLRLSALL